MIVYIDWSSLKYFRFFMTILKTYNDFKSHLTKPIMTIAKPGTVARN